MHRKDKNGNAVFDSKPRDLFTEANFRKFERSWDDGRVATAFFRGENFAMFGGFTRCVVDALIRKEPRTAMSTDIPQARPPEEERTFTTTNA